MERVCVQIPLQVRLEPAAKPFADDAFFVLLARKSLDAH